MQTYTWDEVPLTCSLTVTCGGDSSESVSIRFGQRALDLIGVPRLLSALPGPSVTYTFHVVGAPAIACATRCINQRRVRVAALRGLRPGTDRAGPRRSSSSHPLGGKSIAFDKLISILFRELEVRTVERRGQGGFAISGQRQISRLTKHPDHCLHRVAGRRRLRLERLGPEGGRGRGRRPAAIPVPAADGAGHLAVQPAAAAGGGRADRPATYDGCGFRGSAGPGGAAQLDSEPLVPPARWPPPRRYGSTSWSTGPAAAGG